MEAKQYVTKHQWITEEIKDEVKKYLDTNDHEIMMIQNLWDTARAVLRGKFLAIQSYLREYENVLIKNLTLQLKQLEKEEQNKPQS